MQLATQELAWLNEKEELEVSRDWSSQTLNVRELEDYLEVIIVYELASDSCYLIHL